MVQGGDSPEHRILLKVFHKPGLRKNIHSVEEAKRNGMNVICGKKGVRDLRAECTNK